MESKRITQRNGKKYYKLRNRTGCTQYNWKKIMAEPRDPGLDTWLFLDYWPTIIIRKKIHVQYVFIN